MNVDQMCPQWWPGVQMVPTEPGMVHIITDGIPALALAGADDRLVAWLQQLDGQRSWLAQVHQARAIGIERAVAQQVLTRLWDCGLVRDRSNAGLEPHHVMVFGPLALSAAVVRLLPGISSAGLVPHPDTEAEAGPVPLPPDGTGLAVVGLAGSMPNSLEVGFCERLQAAGWAVLPLGAGSRSARVGPLVWPGQTPCVRCEDLHRADVVPAWPRIAQVVALTRPPQPDPLWVRAAATEAVRHIRRWLAEAGTGSVPNGSAVLEVDAESETWTARPLRRHVDCGCWWAA